MKNKILVFVILPFLFLMLSCTNKKGATIGDYLLFYQAGGFAGGSQQPYYLLSSGKLQADTSAGLRQSSMSVNNLNFNYQLPAAKYNMVSNLLASIPAEMLNNNNKDFGTSPGMDMGGIVVKASLNGQSYTWTFEPDQSASSPAVVQFITEIRLLF